MKNLKGFTLIELMVAVAIISIIMLVAIPQYRQSVIRGNRTAVQAELMQISAALERYKAQNLNYTNASLDTLYGSNTFPKSASEKTLYDLSLTIPSNGVSWALTASPKNIQQGNGALELHSDGRRCWNPGSDSGCDEGDVNQSWSAKH
jgi:type IV pilus assembly protein PilE